VRHLLARHAFLIPVALVTGLLVAWTAGQGAGAREAWRREVAARGLGNYLVATLAGERYALPAWSPEALAALREAPGVEAVAWASGVLRVVGQGPPEGYRLVSPAYLEYAGIALRSGRVEVGGALRPEPGALGRSPGGLPVTGSYRGPGPWLVVADEDMLATWSPPVRVFTLALRTRGPAGALAGRVERWARARDLLPEGVRLEPGPALLHPDRARLRDPLLRGLFWAGYGTAALAAAFGVLVAGAAAYLAVRRGASRRFLLLLLGADPAGLFARALAVPAAWAGLAYLIGAALGLVLAGGEADPLAVGAIVAVGFLLLASVTAAVARGLLETGVYHALRAAAALPRSRATARLAGAVVFLALGTLAFSLASGSRARTEIQAWIARAGPALYQVAPEFHPGDRRPVRRLGAETLAELVRRWPEVPMALVARFPSAELELATGERRRVGTIVSLGKYWETVGIELSVGDGRGMVVTETHADLYGKEVSLALGPVALPPCRVTGRAAGVPGVPGSPRLPPGWVWLDAQGACWGGRPFHAVVLAVLDPAGLHAQAIATWLSRRFPEARPFKARRVAQAGEARLAEYRELAGRMTQGLVGVLLLGVIALVFLGGEVLGAWRARLALSELFGASPRARVGEALRLSMGIFGLPGAIGALLGGWLGGAPAWALAGALAWLLVVAGVGATFLLAGTHPARRLVEKGPL